MIGGKSVIDHRIEKAMRKKGLGNVEIGILSMVRNGKLYGDISMMIGVSYSTVARYMAISYAVLNVKNRSEFRRWCDNVIYDSQN